MQENPRTTPSLWDRLCPELYVFGYQLRDYVSSRVDAAFSAARWAIFGSIRMRLFNTRFNQAISFILPTLASLLQLKYLGNTQTPFTTHPLTMTTAVSTAFGYYCAYIVQLKCSSPRFMLFANCCMALLGNVAVASLASVFFPDPMRPLVYFMTVLVSSAELIREVYQSLFVTDYGHPVPRFFRNLGSPSWFERSGILAR